MPEFVDGGRAAHRPGADVSDFLAESGLGTAEGVALLCLAEALLRIPDAATADALIEDRIGAADWQKHWATATPGGECVGLGVHADRARAGGGQCRRPPSAE